ncbi:MAG: hypothetical protein RBR19_16875 [Sedimentisphaerales bacterium]|jgi:hypothetical protein|nr:hypothetical protein [Sedimentisphaerales bacterium]
MGKNGNIDWAPGMKEGLKEAGKSGKERQRKIDELAKKGLLSEEGIEHILTTNYSDGCGGSGSGGGCGGGY